MDENIADNLWAGKSILITGVSGTVGRELLRQVVAKEPVEVIGLDNNETELFFLCEEYRNHPNVHLYLGPYMLMYKEILSRIN